MPPIEAGGYLLEAFLAAGAWHDGNILPWAEIKAFAELTNRISEPWEAELIRRMSREYCAGRKIGANALGIPPWEG